MGNVNVSRMASALGLSEDEVNRIADIGDEIGAAMTPQQKIANIVIGGFKTALVMLGAETDDEIFALSDGTILATFDVNHDGNPVTVRFTPEVL